MSKRIVIAVGGNALIKDKEHQTEKDQYFQVKKTCEALLPLFSKNLEIVITHGNGPQVGFIMQRSELGFNQLKLHRVPLDTADAETQGAIGFYLQQSLDNIITKKKLNKKAVTVVTQVLVDKNDPAFNNPTKPIGSFYTKAQAKTLYKKYGWAVEEDAGRGWRRVVASPKPIDVIEKDIVQELIKNNTIVIACGGGGIPVVEERGKLKGVEAVIDKDFASALLANQIKADTLVIATAVDNVYINFGKPDQKKLEKINIQELKKYIEQNHFAKGSMLPKIQAVINFLENGGKEAIITSPNKLASALEGKSGTRITN
ncbi:MAG TPA: carbamate kinase [Candidatus Magasanikbacteria bacterium]|nr:carbamate kinase [Candidatus Magasanikbacteria bacterium]